MPHALAISAHSPRIRAKRERRREEILRAALRAFREHGYHQTTLDDIATRLDIRKSALYHYFPDKESILYECHRESLGELERIMAEARALRTPRQRLQHVIREHVRVMTNTLEGSPLAFEVTALAPERQAKIIAARDQYERELRRIVEQGIRDGEFRRVDTKVAAFAMLGAINWIARWYRPEGTLQADTLGVQFADHLLDGLAAVGAGGRTRTGRTAPRRTPRKERP